MGTINKLYRADCKEAIQDLLDKGIKIDLIYLDPPFNSSRTYNLIYENEGVTAQHKAFTDTWMVTSQNQQLLIQFETILEGNEEISQVVRNFLKAWVAPLKMGPVEDQKMLVYLIYMTERLLLMKKVLKETGSIYLHCDPTASHYLKIIMDGIFGRKNFRNEIVWCYRQGGRSKKEFPHKHDVIFWYSLGSKWIFNPDRIRIPYEGTGGYQTSGKGVTNKNTGKTYKPNPLGKIPEDWWDIPSIPPMAKERLGYPTQKPIALLNRILQASCSKDGMVLDPFCGCGTTIASAIENGVNWIGVDISYDATDVIKKRIKTQSGVDVGLYEFIDGSPETRQEYERLDPYQKQDWLIRKVGGFPNPKKSGDGGIDGELTVYLGLDDKGQDQWGKMVFSVKTGKQRVPELVRELAGTVEGVGAVMGGLILDADPTPGMEMDAQKRGEIEYSFLPDMPKSHFQKIQIITSQEIIDGKRFATPHSLAAVQSYRENVQQNL